MIDLQKLDVKEIKLPYRTAAEFFTSLSEHCPKVSNTAESGKNLFTLCFFSKEELAGFAEILPDEAKELFLCQTGEYNEQFFKKSLLAVVLSDERSGGNVLTLRSAEENAGVLKLAFSRKRALTMDMSSRMLLVSAANTVAPDIKTCATSITEEHDASLI